MDTQRTAGAAASERERERGKERGEGAGSEREASAADTRAPAAAEEEEEEGGHAARRRLSPTMPMPFACCRGLDPDAARAKAQSEAIDRRLKSDGREIEREIKLLLLGACAPPAPGAARGGALY